MKTTLPKLQNQSGNTPLPRRWQPDGPDCGAEKEEKNIMKKSRILIPIALAILAVHLAPAATAGPLDIWTWRNPLPTGTQLNGITYGNSLFVAVGANSTIVTSPDGAKENTVTAVPRHQPFVVCVTLDLRSSPFVPGQPLQNQMIP